MNSIKDSVLEALINLKDILVEFFPKLVITLVILLIGWIIAKIVKVVLKKVMKAAKIDQLAEKMKLDEVLAQIGIRSPLSKIVSTIAYYIIFLMFLVVSTDYLGVESISSGIKIVMGYIPTLITSLVVFVVGLLLATIVKKSVYSVTNSIGLSGAQAISNIVYYLILVLVAVTAIDQAGVETSLIRTYLIMIMGSMLIAFAVGYGIASRNIVSNMLSSYYGKTKFSVGQKVKIGELSGEIEKIDNLSVVLKTGEKKIVVPSQRFLSEDVEIFN
ncbi:MAG: mechanosensitive ion channel [Flavobacteriales bacterium]|nr:mechanosensitive ion channel [Flavobacteriales bacterium]